MSEKAVITKTAQRSRYPWDKLIVGGEFTIPADNRQGCDNARQLCYAATRSAKNRGLPNKYKSFKQPDGSVLVKRVE